MEDDSRERDARRSVQARMMSQLQAQVQLFDYWALRSGRVADQMAQHFRTQVEQSSATTVHTSEAASRWEQVA